jgi:hypothetical protein
VSTAGFCWNRYDDDEYDEYGEYGYGGGYLATYNDDYYSRRKSRCGKGKPAKKAKEFDGEVMLELAGHSGLCQIALTHLVAVNAIECRALYSENEKEKEKIADILQAMLPKCMSRRNLDKIKNAIVAMMARYNELVGKDSDAVAAAQTAAAEFCATAARIYEKDVVREYSQYVLFASRYNVRSGLDTVVERTNLLLRIINVHVDFKSMEPDCFATGFVLSKDGWSMEEFLLDDLLDIADMSTDDTLCAVMILLAECQDNFDIFANSPLSKPLAGGAGVTWAGEDADGSGRHSPTLEELDETESDLHVEDYECSTPDVEDATGGHADDVYDA